MPANALLMLPDFALILLGWALARWVRLGQDFWRGTEKLVYYVLFPALLFGSINVADFSIIDAGDFFVAGWVPFGCAIALGFLAAPLLRPERKAFASSVQTAFRFNSYIGLALAGSLYGSKGVALMALLIAVAVPVANVFAVTALAHGQGTRGLWRQLMVNPLIVSTVAGLATNALGWHPPAPLAAILLRLGNASLALGLLTIGAGLQVAAVAQARVLVGWMVAVRLLAAPLVALLLIRWLRMSPMEAHVAMLFAALPTASSAYILATRMGGNGPLVAGIVTLQTLLSMLTLPVWVALTGA